MYKFYVTMCKLRLRWAPRYFDKQIGINKESDRAMIGSGFATFLVVLGKGMVSPARRDQIFV